MTGLFDFKFKFCLLCSEEEKRLLKMHNEKSIEVRYKNLK